MYGRKEASAISLVLLMILSTQIALIAEWDFDSKELTDNSQRFDTNNAGVNLISLGDDSACAIGTNQKMKCWGDGSFGKTGHGNTEDYGDEEDEMGRYLYFTDVGEGITFTDIAIGETFSCALTNDSAIRCWGENDKLGSSAGLSGSGAVGDGYREMGANINVVDIGTWNGTSVEAEQAPSLNAASSEADNRQPAEDCSGEEAQSRVQEFLASNSLDSMINIATESLEQRTLSRLQRDPQS